MDQWDIGLGAAVIQAGQYGDFHRAQYVMFAPSFSVSDARLATTTTRAAVPLGGSEYRVTGEVVYLADDVCVLDFGLRAYQAALAGLPQVVRAGAFVTAEISLGVDDGPYEQALLALPSMPPLVYTWYLQRIGAVIPDSVDDTARPADGAAGDAGKDPNGDSDPLSRDEDIEQTDAWAHDANASYILSCTRMDYAPQYVRALPWARGAATSGGDESGGRVLRFPMDRAVGLLTRYVGAGEDGEARWETCDAARGAVTIPPDSWLGLTVLPSVTDLSSLAALGPDDLWRVDLSASRIGNAQLAHLRGLTELRELALRDAADVDDTGVYHLRSLDALQDLNLASTAVTDAGLAYLHGLSALQTLVLTGAPVTVDGIAALRRALPGCTVYSSVEGAE